ncbi:MAG: DEAD/DEAH box helicase family protein, partial [Prolixibacteraceae bacterium]|nr:DEAD/DEAH box helicase family protein [Prolixibacteraceae bacterium]
MLNEILNNSLLVNGPDFFKSKVSDEIIKNLNPAFAIREYQREAIGRFAFYFSGFAGKQNPSQLLFHMATGSGKTLIMASNILHLYTLGYRNFVFFVNSTNIIEKTKDNFLNQNSSKYLFNKNITFGNKQIKINAVENFDGSFSDDINIIFTTIQGLHTRMNEPKENAITIEDFSNNKTVLISDEAHHINALTKIKNGKQNQASLFDNNKSENIDIKGLTKTEQEEVKSWENTVMNIFNSNPDNILLEYTATIDFYNENIKAKYEPITIFQYDLKEYRKDKYSKEIEVLQADLDTMDRCLQTVIISQYRRKIAEKNGIFLKPVILFKSKDIKTSEANWHEFGELIKKLKSTDLKKLEKLDSENLKTAFNYFKRNKISLDNLIKELKIDFEESKCLLLDSKNITPDKQLLLNSLEDKYNEVRAIFAVDMLNEGWDVLNLFDIVRLYDTRDAKSNKPGSTTMSEAQLIGRGARYYPFVIKNGNDKYVRKFDEDAENELRILEKLLYHSAHNPKYIQELNTALIQIGIKAEKTISKKFEVKVDIKRTDWWSKGIVFQNKKIKNDRTDIKEFGNSIKRQYSYNLHSGFVKEDEILNTEKLKLEKQFSGTDTKQYKLTDLGENIIRHALNKTDFYSFNNLISYFPSLSSISDFIRSKDFLSKHEVLVTGPKEIIENLPQKQKLDIAIYILKQTAKDIENSATEYIGTKEFEAKMVKDVFKDKVLKIDGDSPRAIDLNEEIDLRAKRWYAQNSLFGTSEEKDFVKFFDVVVEKLKKRYLDIVLFRNERDLPIYNFNDGATFEPDFILFLKEMKTNKMMIYQVFIEPKGNQFKD